MIEIRTHGRALRRIVLEQRFKHVEQPVTRYYWVVSLRKAK